MIDFQQIITASVIDAISGLIRNIIYIVLIIWGVKTLVKEVPSWISQYEQSRLRVMNIERAVGRVTR